MSATNRGAERVEADDYPTPDWCVHRLLDRLIAKKALPRGLSWLEPCAGDGAIIGAVLNHQVADWFGIKKFTAFDIRDTQIAAMDAGADQFARLDYLAEPAAGCRADVVITNPPFSLALPMVQKAASEAQIAIFLLRVNFLGSGVKSGRSSWLRSHMPDVYVLPNRPAFVASYKCVLRGEGEPVRLGGGHKKGCGYSETLPIAKARLAACPKCGGKLSCSTTDATEYAWMIWHSSEVRTQRTQGTIEILDETSAKTRTLSMFNEWPAR